MRKLRPVRVARAVSRALGAGLMSATNELPPASDPAVMADRLLAALVPGSSGAVRALRRLSGGANMETWAFDLEHGSATVPLILRRQPGVIGRNTTDWNELGIADEAALLSAAGATGVPVPTVRHLLTAGDELGEGYVMSRERGEALPQRLLSDARFAAARDKLAWQCGHALGQIHKVPVDTLPAGLPDHSGPVLFEHAQSLLDTHDNGSPVLQLGLDWLRDNRPGSQSKALVHGDFRNGNLLVDEGGLVAVLDWELAHLGDPVRDLGYLSANVWRFGADAPVGGFGQYDDLLAGYEAATGQRPAMDEIIYWQAYAALFWGTVCLIMLEKYRSGEDASLERAAVGRRLSEAEIDLLLLLEGNLR